MFAGARVMKRLSPLRNVVMRNFSTEPPKPPKMASFSRGPVTFASLGITVLVAGGLWMYFEISKEEKMKEVSKNVVSVGKPALGGPWSLVDHHGTPVTDATYKGKLSLLYFGFTHCPDICPSELVKVAKIMNELEKRGVGSQVQPLFISVDPSRDTVGQLRHYGQDFHKSIIYLTGTTEQVAKAARAFRVYFSKVNDADLDSEEEYLVDHSIVLYLVGANGDFLDFFTQRMEVKEVVEKIAKYAKDEGLVK